MLFEYHMPASIYFGRGCVARSWTDIAGLGSRFFLVTGPSSGKRSGALDDVTALLKKSGIHYDIFDGIENNPSLENVERASIKAREFKADVVVGIGGGSPLDAAKAVAVLAVNEIEPARLFENTFPILPLPIVAIPTTSGTGSEVTPYSVLTRTDLETKMSFGNRDTFPRIACLDPAYTGSMPRSVTIDTAVDAFSHALEGYISKQCSPLSDLYAVEAISLFGKCLENLLEGEITGDVRDKLMYAAMLGGLVITRTKTSVVHSLGYSLTYYWNIPHGRANGVFLEQFLRLNYSACKDRVDKVLELTGMRSLEQFGSALKRLCRPDIRLTDDEIKRYAEAAYAKKGTHNNPVKITQEDLEKMLWAVAGGENDG